LSRATDWEKRKSISPIRYVKWSPEDYYGAPSENRTIGKVIGFEGAVALVDVGRGLCRRFLADIIRPLLENRPVSVGDTVALPEDVVEASRPFFYDPESDSPPLTWEAVKAAYHSREILRGLITQPVKAGYLVNIAGYKAFLPESHVDRRPYQNIVELMGEPQPFIILSVGGMYPDDLVVSRSAAIDLAEANMRKIILDEHIVGERVTGTVKSIVPYGAFVDLGWIVGLLHNSEISHHKNKLADECLSVGDNIETAIKHIDHETGKIQLSLKQIIERPWDTFIEEHGVGDRFIGTLANVMHYGIFVELEPGIEGLIHASQIDWHPVSRGKKAFRRENKSLEVVILHIDDVKKRIGLGIVEDIDKIGLFEIVYPVGSVVSGPIMSISDAEIVVDLQDGLVGLVIDMAAGECGDAIYGTLKEWVVCSIDRSLCRIMLRKWTSDSTPT
jgi:small subunit ribosomal protein S1